MVLRLRRENEREHKNEETQRTLPVQRGGAARLLAPWWGTNLPVERRLLEGMDCGNHARTGKQNECLKWKKFYKSAKLP